MIHLLGASEATDPDGSPSSVSPDAVRAATGWELKPEGLCRAEVCVPIAPAARDLLTPRGDGRLALDRLAEALGARVVVDEDLSAAAISVAAVNRSSVLVGATAEAFSLPDVCDGSVRSLSDWSDKKKLLVAWASW